MIRKIRKTYAQQSKSLMPSDTNPCDITSVTQIPQKICPCAKQLLGWVRQAKDLLENPENIATSIWPKDYWQYGPKKIGNSRGWWFRIYKPTLTLDFETQKLKIKAKAGVKKTRGAVQFSWRKASHNFVFDIPYEMSQFAQAKQFLGEVENKLNVLVQNIQQLGLCPPEIKPSKMAQGSYRVK